MQDLASHQLSTKAEQRLDGRTDGQTHVFLQMFPFNQNISERDTILL